MREFIYYSRTAPTSGNFGTDLMKAGRLDIAIHVVINSFFLSHKMRGDVRLNLLFAGPPNSPRNLELMPVLDGKSGIDKIYLSKKNVSAVLKKMLYKFKKEKKTEVFPGYWIEEKSFLKLIQEKANEGRNLYLLDPKGEDIRECDIGEDPIFILGDHLGMPSKELKRLKKICNLVTVGKKTYFASQTVSIVNNEIDRREESGNL
jgi:tRNA (pseudouridine54-N1)-methyltransferase